MTTLSEKSRENLRILKILENDIYLHLFEGTFNPRRIC